MRSQITLRLISAVASSLLLLPILLPFQLLGRMTSQNGVLLFVILLISYLVFALPVSLILDAFLGRVERLGNWAKFGVKAMSMLLVTSLMATYILFLTKSMEAGTAGPVYLYFIVGAVIYLLAERVLIKLALSRQK